MSDHHSRTFMPRTLTCGDAGGKARELESMLVKYDLTDSYKKELHGHAFAEERLTKNPASNAQHRLQTAAQILEDRIKPMQLLKDFNAHYGIIFNFDKVTVKKPSTLQLVRDVASLTGVFGEKSKKQATHNLAGILLIKQNMTASEEEYKKIKTPKVSVSST